MTKIKWNPPFAIHPGTMKSKSDGDIHFIGALALASLYELKPGEYIVWRDDGSSRACVGMIIYIFTLCIMEIIRIM